MWLCAIHKCIKRANEKASWGIEGAWSFEP